MNVLSLFDGMSCGQIAFEKLGVTFDGVKNIYYSSEINKNSIYIANKNYPKTIQIGNVSDIKTENMNSIDVLIGGSPCQGFSVAGKKLNFDDERSKLFFEYVRMLKETKPKYFLFENVATMTDEIADCIDNILGVKRIFINSVYFTGHIRKRYYWTNIPVDEYIKKDIYLKDIIDESVTFDKDISFFLDRTIYNPSESRDGIITINPKDLNNKQTWQRGRVYDINGKCPALCASLFDLNITKDHKKYRKLTINECEKLQGVPKNYTDGVSKNIAGEMLGNGWTVDVIVHILKHIK